MERHQYNTKPWDRRQPQLNTKGVLPTTTITQIEHFQKSKQLITQALPNISIKIHRKIFWRKPKSNISKLINKQDSGCSKHQSLRTSISNPVLKNTQVEKLNNGKYIQWLSKMGLTRLRVKIYNQIKIGQLTIRIKNCTLMDKYICLSRL